MAKEPEKLKGKIIFPGHDSDDSDSQGAEQEDGKGTDSGLSLNLEKLNLGPKTPKKKLLVMGPGDFLVKRVHNRRGGIIPSYCYPDFISGNFKVFRRPFCIEFMKFCLERFEVGIWSSAMRHNMGAPLKAILPGQSDKLLFVWSQDECTETDYNVPEGRNKPMFIKELRKVWKKFPQYNASNTLFIDDEPWKALLNPSYTSIFPHPYKLENRNDTALGSKSELRTYLEELAGADDVPSYVKQHQIGQAAVTESHPKWDFYSKVIRSLKK